MLMGGIRSEKLKLKFNTFVKAYDINFTENSKNTAF